MSFRRIALTDLVINKDNDRHGELPDETAAIAWLLGNHVTAMWDGLAGFIVRCLNG